MKTNLITFISVLIVAATTCSCSSTKATRKFREKDEVNTLHQLVHVGEKAGYPCPSTGNAKVFVVPVEFTDYPADEIGMLYNSEVKNNKALKHYKEDGYTPAGNGRGKENALKDITNVYFGDAKDTAWHSLKSYYESSSYGNLKFEGLVSPWISAFTNINTCNPVSAKEFKDNGGTARSLAQNLLTYYTDEVSKKYKIFKDDNGNQMFNSGKEFLKYFDSNGDGCFDLLEIVYSAPFYATYVNEKGEDVAIDNDMFWAYCGGTTTDGNVNAPKLSKWAWQSYYTTVEAGVYDGDTWRPWTCEEISNGVAKGDAHTIVHETGHGLGLDDYYDYDYKRSPLCGTDMMDHNVGDHNAYSKSLLGWTNPTIILDSTTVTINSFTKTGDCLMIPYRGFFDTHEDFGNTFYNEYLTIELYNPTGVNEVDSKQKYAGKGYPLCPDKSGLKIFHVDARLGVFDYSGSTAKFANYTETIVSTSSTSYVSNAHSNTGSKTLKRTVGSKEYYNWLIEYIGHDEDETTGSISSENLFVEGDKFGTDGNYENYTFNSGNAFGFKFSIDKLSDDSATITFVAI